jgi:YHS domain-containing protein
VVAYFSLKPGADGVLGSSDFAFVYQGYSYYFATAANLKLFAASPASYVPQWGGFCSYGVSSETWWGCALPHARARAPREDKDKKLFFSSAFLRRPMRAMGLQAGP